jgi:hypothetical protein
MTEAEEFYAALAVWGGLLFAGALVSGVLALIGLGVMNRVTWQTFKTKIFNEKERQNGQHKKNSIGGARGKW